MKISNALEKDKILLLGKEEYRENMQRQTFFYFCQKSVWITKLMAQYEMHNQVY